MSQHPEQDPLDPNQDPDSLVDQAQPLVSHLIELRSRLLRSVLCVMIVFCGLYAFANDIYLIVSEPLRVFLPEGSSMIATDVASPFFTPFKLALMSSVFISMPYMLFQIWGFIAPAMYENEKRLAYPLFLSSIILFYLGMAFAYFVVFPLVFGFFTSAAPEGVTVMTDISRYLDFILKLFFAFGLAFEIPIATIILVAGGVTSASSLTEKRPYIIVGCFVIGMLLTPPDVISQMLLAIPMWALFEVGVLFSRLVEENRDKEDSVSD
jgi:sec-independent protein translocase protein TatC